MHKIITFTTAVLIVIGSTFTTTGDAEAGWRKRGYSHSGRHYRPAYAPRYGYRRPYYGRPYYGRPYYGRGYYGGGYGAGAALGGIVLGLAAIAAIQAAQGPSDGYGYGYAPPAYPQPRGPLPAGAIGVDTNGQPVCIGGPDRC